MKKIHLALKKSWSGYVSACGDNSAMIESSGKLIKAHGAALRTTDVGKVSCVACLKLLPSLGK